MKRWLSVLIFLAAPAFAQEPKPSLSDLAKGPSNVALTVYLVSGLAQPQASAKDEVPADVAETLQQLRGVFTYKSYKLIDEVTLRGRNQGGAEVAGNLPDFSYYDFKYARAHVSPDTRVVHIDGLSLWISHPHANRASDTVALVHTDLDVRDGQKTVVGKSAVNATDAIFLVIVPKVID